MKNHYFVIEGNIGAGKSTFLRLLQKKLPIQAVFEPHDKWRHVIDGENLLDAFYRDVKRWGYTFQTYAFITRVMQQTKQAKEDPYAVQVVERSVFSDRYCFAKNCFDKGFIQPVEWAIYLDWFEWLIENYLNKPTGFIYLSADPQVCYDRLKKRARREEKSVPLSYIQEIHEKHESWLIKKQNIKSYLLEIPILTLPCNGEFEKDPHIFQQHTDQIVDFITNIIPTKWMAIHKDSLFL